MENAGLSVGLMYGGGGQGAVSQGGQATQPSGPTSNPIGMALQYRQIEQQDAAIKSQTMLNQAEAAKALAEAGKTAGPEYKKATWEAKNLEIENRIKIIISEAIVQQRNLAILESRYRDHPNNLS